jgi:hypothetical protein
LFHEHGFVGGKDAVKESGFDIKMLEVPVKGGSEVEDGAEGFKANGGGGSFVVVNAILLGKAFGYIADFVSNYVPRVVVFAFADKFAFKWTLSGGDV